MKYYSWGGSELCENDHGIYDLITGGGGGGKNFDFYDHEIKVRPQGI